MKNKIGGFKKIIGGLTIYLLAFSCVLASNSNDAVKVSLNSKATSKAVVQHLTKKLKADLVHEKVLVKIENIAETHVSSEIIRVEGDATCLLPTEKTQLPIKFEAKFNRAGQAVDDVQYTFVESEYAPTSEEEILMKEIMKKISHDYKTQDIVMAIDNFESSDASADRIHYKGVGEVKIGGIRWNKIDFNVVLSADKSASKIEYKIQ